MDKYSYDHSREVYRLFESGLSKTEIANKLGICKQSVGTMIKTYSQHLLQLEAMDDLREYRNT